jgi:hypothetical protein
MTNATIGSTHFFLVLLSGRLPGPGAAALESMESSEGRFGLSFLTGTEVIGTFSTRRDTP